MSLSSSWYWIMGRVVRKEVAYRYFGRRLAGHLARPAAADTHAPNTAFTAKTAVADKTKPGFYQAPDGEVQKAVIRGDCTCDPRPFGRTPGRKESSEKHAARLGRCTTLMHA
jgi:hypothetical protein